MRLNFTPTVTLLSKCDAACTSLGAVVISGSFYLGTKLEIYDRRASAVGLSIGQSVYWPIDQSVYRSISQSVNRGSKSTRMRDDSLRSRDHDARDDM